MSHIISVANQKGGVGKTTTTINLAQAFAAHGLKVLVVDLDPQGNTSLGLGLELESIEQTSGDLIRNMDLPVSCVTYQIGGLDVIPARRSLGAVESEMVGKPGRQLRLAQRLRDQKSKYSVILIDTPPSFGPLMNSSLNAADYIVVPVDCGIFSMQGIKDLLAELTEVQESTNPNVKVLGYLLNMFDGTKVVSEARDVLIADFGDLVFETCINRSVKLKEAPTYGRTIFHHAKNSVGARDYLRLSIEIIQKLQIAPEIDSELYKLAYPQGNVVQAIVTALAGGAA